MNRKQEERKRAAIALCHLTGKIPTKYGVRVMFGDESRYDKPAIEIKAHSIDEVEELKDILPTAVWRRTWSEYCEWFEWTATWEGIKLRLWACREAPPQCTPITETVEKEKEVPVNPEAPTKTVTVTEEKIVGWNCGNNGTEETVEHKDEEIE